MRSPPQEQNVLVGVGLSETTGSVGALEEALAQARRLADHPAPEAVLLWVTHHHAAALPALLDTLRSQGGPQHLAGCVAPGVIAGDREVFDSPGVAVMTFHDAAPWRLSTLIIRDVSARNEQAAQALVAALQPGDLALAMISTSGFSPERFERGLRTEREGLTVIGGGGVNMGGPDWVFTAWGPHDDAMAVFIVRACKPACGLSQSCRPVTRPMRVAGSRGRVVAALDGRPAARALGRLSRALGIPEADIGQRVMVGLSSSPDPAAIARGDLCVRPVLGVEDRIGALYLGGEAHDGDWATFLLRDQSFARMDLNGMALELGAQVRARGPAEFAMLVDCSGRGPAFQGMPEHDAAIVAAQLGRIPMAGFFSGFELAPRPTPPASIHLFSTVAALGWEPSVVRAGRSAPSRTPA